MWSSVGCLVVVLLAFDAANAFDRTKTKEKITDFRIRSQNLHIDSAEKGVEDLENEFESLSPPPDDIEITRIKARVRNLEGNKCPDKHVSCGGDWPECVHHLLVCDGHKDCHNGRDEDEKVCDGSVVQIGSSFRGIVHWHRCVQAEDHYWTFTITGAKRSPFFTNRSFLRATVTREYEDHTLTSYTARGYFVYAARKLVLIADPGTHTHVAVICSFKFGDNDHAECKVAMETSLEECGLVKVIRV
jgi:hypothetical protein